MAHVGLSRAPEVHQKKPLYLTHLKFEYRSRTTRSRYLFVFSCPEGNKPLKVGCTCTYPSIHFHRACSIHKHRSTLTQTRLYCSLVGQKKKKAANRVSLRHHSVSEVNKSAESLMLCVMCVCVCGCVCGCGCVCECGCGCGCGCDCGCVLCMLRAVLCYICSKHMRK